MKKILFLDIDPKKTRDLQVMAINNRGEWKVSFQNTPKDAQRLLETEAIDVIVSEIHTPDLAGVDLLSQAHRKYPHIAKIAISDQKKILNHLSSAGLAQQFLLKPYSMKDLETSILRAFTLSDLLVNNMLQRLISQVRSLPSLPTVYLRIADEFNSPDPSADKVGSIIAEDMSMSAKVLQLVNSAYFGLSQQVASPTQATALLGLQTIRDLVLSIEVFSQFDHIKIRYLGLNLLWYHSVRVGTFSRIIADSVSRDSKTKEYAFAAGLLHDLGMLVLAENLPMKYKSALGLSARKNIEIAAAERKIFGATHAQVGAYLLWLWNLPNPIITATAYHHNPGDHPADGINPVTAVHMANVFDYTLHPPKNKRGIPAMDTQYLSTLGLDNRVEDLFSACERSQT